MQKKLLLLTLIALALISFWAITAGQIALAGEMVIKESQEQGRQEMLSSAAVLAALESFNLSQDEIIVVQPIWVTLDDGQFEYWEIVITESGDYWYHPESQRIIIESPTSITGSRSAYLRGLWCEKVGSDWKVVFYLPTCFWEYTYGRFDGIIDAWASSCSPKVIAWTNRGYEGWYNYLTCSQNPRMSTKVGKGVQTSWYFYHSWICREGNSQIANRVVALITW